MTVEVNGLFLEKRIVAEFACYRLVKEEVEFFITWGFFKEFKKILFLFLADFQAMEHEVNHPGLDL